MKTLKFKINYFLILIFLIIPFSAFAEDLFLINPSSQCKKYLSESFSNILNIDKGVYKLSIIGWAQLKPNQIINLNICIQFKEMTLL